MTGVDVQSAGEGHQAAEGGEEGFLAAAGEVGAAPAVVEEGIAGEEVVASYFIADAAGGMAGGMEDLHSQAGQGEDISFPDEIMGFRAENIPVQQHTGTVQDGIPEHRGIQGVDQDAGGFVREGFGGILCIETGGPTPGLGCAGRGILTTFALLEDLELFETAKPDIVLYDVLGDVVCGGFAAPIREGYAEDILIVTSGEKMALYAANNICKAVKNFEDRGYASVRGILLNRRNVPGEREKVEAFAAEHHLPILADIPRSDDILRFEELGKTVIEGDPTLPVSQVYLDLARTLLKEAERNT